MGRGEGKGREGKKSSERLKDYDMGKNEEYAGIRKDRKDEGRGDGKEGGRRSPWFGPFITKYQIRHCPLVSTTST